MHTRELLFWLVVIVASSVFMFFASKSDGAEPYAPDTIRSPSEGTALPGEAD